MRDRSQRASRCGWVLDQGPAADKAHSDSTGEPLMGSMRLRIAVINKRRIEEDRRKDALGR